MRRNISVRFESCMAASALQTERPTDSRGKFRQRWITGHFYLHTDANVVETGIGQEVLGAKRLASGHDDWNTAVESAPRNFLPLTNSFRIIIVGFICIHLSL